MAQQEKKIQPLDLWRIFARSFFIQAVWNFKSMIAVGFCFALMPVARRLYPEKKDRVAFMIRHLSFFNAHPYFASFALGAVARLEEQYANGQLQDVEMIDRLKNAIIGPLGAIGDQYFWNNVKPASLLMGLAAVALLPDLSSQITALIIMLLMYNIPHLSVRIRGVFMGYEQGFNIYKALRMERFQRVKLFYAALGAVALGVFIGYTIHRVMEQSVLNGINFIVTGAVAYYVRKYTHSFYIPVVTALIISLIMGLL